MTRLFALLPLTACVLYDTTDGRCAKCAPGDDGMGGEETPAPEPVYTFALTPSIAEAGQTFIASLTVEGEFDLSLVESVEFFGDVGVAAVENRGEELLMSLTVSPQALPGTVDMMLHLPDGEVAFFDEALEVLPAAPADEDGTGGDGTGGDGTSGDGTGTGGGTDCP